MPSINGYENWAMTTLKSKYSCSERYEYLVR